MSSRDRCCNMFRHHDSTYCRTCAQARSRTCLPSHRESSLPCGNTHSHSMTAKRDNIGHCSNCGAACSTAHHSTDWRGSNLPHNPGVDISAFSCSSYCFSCSSYSCQTRFAADPGARPGRQQTRLRGDGIGKRTENGSGRRSAMGSRSSSLGKRQAANRGSRVE